MKRGYYLNQYIGVYLSFGLKEYGGGLFFTVQKLPEG